MKIELTAAQVTLIRWALIKFAAASEPKVFVATMDVYELLGGEKRKKR